MNVLRRDLLKWGVAMAGWPAAARRLRAGSAPSVKIPIGAILRSESKADVPGAIRAVARMGYKGVQFTYGYLPRGAQELRRLLDDNGLRRCGVHISLSALLGDALEKTIEFNEVLGNPYLIVAGLPSARTASVQSLVDTAKTLSDLAVKLKPHGMRVGYHADAIDFNPVEGHIPPEVIFDNASMGVLMELDVGNCLEGGGDPIRMLRKYPGRSATIHLKEYGDRRDLNIGEGKVDWKPIFQICETTGNTKWYVVETRALPQLPALQRCLEHLRKLGK